MSTDRDVTGIVRAWLEEGVTALPDRVLDSVMEQLPATHQRRARHPAWRLNTMTFRLAAIAASISILAVLVGIVPRALGPGGTNSTASPSPVTTPILPPTACPPGTPLSSGTIATVAGGGTGVAAVDGGPAIAGTLGQPSAVAVDPTGAIYFSDTARLVVRRIAPDGVISTVAGTGKLGDSGDGGRPPLRPSSLREVSLSTQPETSMSPTLRPGESGKSMRPASSVPSQAMGPQAQAVMADQPRARR